MGNSLRLLVAAALSIPLLIGPQASLAAGSNETAWLSLAVGRGVQGNRGDNQMLNATAIALGASVQPGAIIVSFRYTRLGSESATGDIALLLERPVVCRKVRVTAGAGIGMLYGNAAWNTEPVYGEKSTGDGQIAYQHAGAAWHLEVTTNSSASVRAGIQGFGAVAGSGDFWGLALVLHVGPVGKEQGRCDP